MKIALVGAHPQNTLLISKIKKILDNSFIQTTIMTENNFNLANQVDLVFVIGGDRAILDYFHKVVDESAPVIGIYESESTGFLAQIDVRDLETIIPRLKKNDYRIGMSEFVFPASQTTYRKTVPLHS